MARRYEAPASITGNETRTHSAAPTRLRRTRNALATLVVVIAVGGVAAGCGGDDADEGVNQVQSTAQEGLDTATESLGGGETVDIPADPVKLAYTETTAEAEAGTVTLRMENPSEIPHNIAIQTPDQKGEVVGKDGVSEVTLELPAGTYTYYCSVPGHLEGGMKGTLTVK